MGRIVAVTNLKGGIGKTTTVVNVGAGLAHKGARVLLLDLDAQGNLAPALGLKPKRTMYEVLVDNVEPTKCITPARPNLDLIAGDDSLLSAQPIISRRSDWGRVLEQSLFSIKREYDFVLVDVPGSLTVLSVNALSASTDLLVPTTVESLSIKGLDMLFKQVERLKFSTRSVAMIVPTMYDSRLRQSVALLAELREAYGPLIGTPIRVNVRLSEATAQGKTIYEHDARSRGAIDYAHLVDTLSQMWKFQPVARQQPAIAANGHTSAVTSAPVAPSRPSVASQPASTTRGESARAAPANHRAASERNEHTNIATDSPVVAGAGNTVQTCPYCGRPLQRATLAGYRVAFCNHCKYKQQDLVTER